MSPVSRPAPYVPLSVLFVTGKTGTAILDRYGLEGIGVWVSMLAAAGGGNSGQILFRHEDDWGAIGLAGHPPSFTLGAFLRFLGTRKQTRTTRQGRALYVHFTQWERWNNERKRETARQQKARKRAESRPDNEPDTVRTENGHMPDPDTEAETETELTMERLQDKERRRSQKNDFEGWELPVLRDVS